MAKLTRFMTVSRALILDPVKGISEKESYFTAHFLNARNEISELERMLDIELHRERETSQAGNLFTRYTLKDSNQVRKVANLFNLKLKVYHARGQLVDERLLEEADIENAARWLKSGNVDK